MMRQKKAQIKPDALQIQIEPNVRITTAHGNKRIQAKGVEKIDESKMPLMHTYKDEFDRIYEQ